MNREFLESLELEKETIDSIMKEHGKTIQSVKQEDAEKDTTIATLQKQLDDRNADLKELQKNADSDGSLKEELDTMTKKYESEKSELEKQLATQKKNAEIRLGVTKAGAKNERAVLALLNADEIRVDDEGVNGLKEQIEQLQESDPYLFQSENDPSGQSSIGGNTGGNVNHNKGKSAFAKASEKYIKK